MGCAVCELAEGHGGFVQVRFRQLISVLSGTTRKQNLPSRRLIALSEIEMLGRDFCLAGESSTIWKLSQIVFHTSEMQRLSHATGCSSHERVRH